MDTSDKILKLFFMVWLFVIVIVAVIGLFIWAHFKVKADEERLLEEDPSALYPFLVNLPLDVYIQQVHSRKM